MREGYRETAITQLPIYSRNLTSCYLPAPRAGRALPSDSISARSALMKCVAQGDIGAMRLTATKVSRPLPDFDKPLRNAAIRRAVAASPLSAPGQRMNAAVADFSKPALVRCRSTMAVLQMRKQTRETRRSSTRRRRPSSCRRLRTSQLIRRCAGHSSTRCRRSL